MVLQFGRKMQNCAACVDMAQQPTATTVLHPPVIYTQLKQHAMQQQQQRQRQPPTDYVDEAHQVCLEVVALRSFVAHNPHSSPR
jgi:hypothetical protein